MTSERRPNLIERMVGLPDTGDAEKATSAAKRRRAPRACISCKARRVRCNVIEDGPPCTNCRLDQVDCVLAESKRMKRSTNVGGDRQTRDGAGKAAHQAQHPPDSASGDMHADSSSSTVHHLQSPRPSVDADGALRVNPKISNHAPAQSKSSRSAETLPNFLKPLPNHIGPDEIAYLDTKGALTLPHDEFRDELLRSFIEFVYPFLPCLDLHHFLKSIDSDGNAGTIGLTLYQAVMFAGSAFVDMEHLEEAGYLSRREARNDLFQRVRALYDFDYDSDRLSLVQTLLLMTYHYETVDDQKDIWHWMGLALSIAQSIGLHRKSEPMDTPDARLRKRIWWSAYMRDGLIALGMRRSSRIQAGDFNVPMLVLDDFDLSPVADTVTCVSKNCVIARDPDALRRLAIMCIEKTKLCVCINRILRRQYCLVNNDQSMPQDRTTTVLFPNLEPSEDTIKTCHDELNSWLNGLPPETRHDETAPTFSSLHLHRSLLHMLFFAALSALYRPQILPSVSGADTDLLRTSHRNVRHAATAIAYITQRLESLGLIRLLPTTGVTCLLPAGIVHVLVVNSSSNPAIRRASMVGLRQCISGLSTLREIYGVADYSSAFLEAAVQKVGIDAPPSSLAQPPEASDATMTTPPLVSPAPATHHASDISRPSLNPPKFNPISFIDGQPLPRDSSNRSNHAGFSSSGSLPVSSSIPDTVPSLPEDKSTHPVDSTAVFDSNTDTAFPNPTSLDPVMGSAATDASALLGLDPFLASTFSTAETGAVETDMSGLGMDFGSASVEREGHGDSGYLENLVGALNEDTWLFHRGLDDLDFGGVDEMLTVAPDP